MKVNALILGIFFYLAFRALNGYAQETNNTPNHALLKVRLKNIEKISEQQKELLAIKNAKIINYITKDRAYLIALHGSSAEELLSTRKKIELIFGPNEVTDFKIPDPAELEALPTFSEKK